MVCRCCRRFTKQVGLSKEIVIQHCDTDGIGVCASSASTAATDKESCAESDSPQEPYFVPRPLTQTERQLAWTAANFFTATEQARPTALWILGPSSVGKSTITVDAAPTFGIPRTGWSLDATEASTDKRRQLDAVVIDGEYMRDAHSVWQEWVATTDWRSAYPALKATINREKDDMCAEAVRQRKNLIIPQTALKLPKAEAEMEEIRKNGYVNHVLAVVAPLDECQRRGRKRELTTGKRYQPAEFKQSISAIPPLIAASNGRFAIVRAIERCDTSRGMDFDILMQGSGGAAESGLGTLQVTPQLDLEAIIAKAVDPLKNA